MELALALELALDFGLHIIDRTIHALGIIGRDHARTARIDDLDLSEPDIRPMARPASGSAELYFASCCIRIRPENLLEMREPVV